MINEELTLSIYKIIRAYGIRPTMFNDGGDIIYYPEEATRFYMKRQNVMVNIEEDSVIIIKGGLTEYEKIKPLVDQIKKITYDNNYAFELKSLNRVIKAKEFSPKAEPIYAVESTAFPKAKGGIKTSYIKLTPKIWIIIKHSKNMKDRDNCRTMPFAIDDMYIKNDYERVQCPCHLKTAKALARHMEKGGDTNDSLALLLIKVGHIIVQLKELIKLFRRNKMTDELMMAKRFKRKIEKDLHALSRKTKYAKLKDSFTSEYEGIDQIDESGPSKIQLDHEIEEYHTCNQALCALDRYVSDYDEKMNQATKELSSLELGKCNCVKDLNTVEFTDTREKILYLIDGIMDEVEDISDVLKDVLQDVRKDVDKRKALNTYHEKFMQQLSNN